MRYILNNFLFFRNRYFVNIIIIKRIFQFFINVIIILRFKFILKPPPLHHKIKLQRKHFL